MLVISGRRTGNEIPQWWAGKIDQVEYLKAAAAAAAEKMKMLCEKYLFVSN